MLPTIYDWSLTVNAAGDAVMSGKVFNHPLLKDYTFVKHTSPVESIEQRGNCIVVKTVSREYKLGYINSAYAQRHPNGRNMFISKYTKDKV